MVADYKLNIEIEKQSEYFKAGLSHLLSPDFLLMFNQVYIVLYLLFLIG